MEKVQLALCGLYFYDFIFSLSFDWSLLVGKDGLVRPPTSVCAKCVKVIYLACRYLVLGSCLVTTYVHFRSERDAIPCWTLVKFATGLGFLGTACSSTLIAVRVAVVWTWNWNITAPITVVLLAVFGTGIRMTISISSSYNPSLRGCDLEHERSNLANVIVLVICDFALLILLLVGLHQWHRPRKGLRAFRLWAVLWNQGVLYLGLASAAEIPTLVFLILNFNPVMNSMFLGAQNAILALAATHFYRSLTAFTPNRSHHEFTDTIAFATVDVGQPAEIY